MPRTNTEDSTVAESSDGVLDARLTERIVALLVNNGVTAPEEAFPFVDVDGDGLLSVADLSQACADVTIAASELQIAEWIRESAAAAGQEQACRLLCLAGAAGFAANAQNLTPHDLAIQNGHVGARRVFQPSASDLDVAEAALSTEDPRGRRPSSADTQWKPETQDPFLTPLMRAAMVGDAAGVALLVKLGARVGDVDAEGRTALHLSAGYGGMDAAAALLDAGASAAATDDGGRTPQAYAQVNDEREVAAMLAEAAGG